MRSGWALVAVGVFPAFLSAFQRPIDPSGFLMSGEYCAIALVVALFAINLTQRRIFIDVTYDQLAITFLRRSGHYTRETWLRGDILEIKASTINRKLIIHSTGHEMISIYLNPNYRITAWVASAINTALAEQFSIPSMADQFPLPSRRRSDAGVGHILFVVAVAMIIVGVALLVVGISLGSLLVVLGLTCIIAAAGITCGTQEKSIY